MSATLRSFCPKFSTLLLFLLFFQQLTAQVNKKNPKEIGIDRFSDVDALVQRNAKAFGNDVVALVWTDTLVYKRELGTFDARTVAPVADASQWLTAVLTLKMVEEGKLSLDDKVAKYLPIFETYGKSYITIRHCLTHFTGIQTDGGLFSKKKFSSLENEVESFAKKDIRVNPGVEFRYSHVGPLIVGRILEIVTKKKFDMLAKQKLFNPLGMRKTTFSDPSGGPVNPADGAQSSAEEYLRFLKMLLNGGKHNGITFLSEASMKELRAITTTPEVIKYAPKAGEGLAYTLGAWAVDEVPGTAAASLSAPALTGTWPLVDWNRKYAFLLFVKNEQGEQKKETYLLMKDAVDGQVGK